jgi:hypothetical protein
MVTLLGPNEAKIREALDAEKTDEKTRAAARAEKEVADLLQRKKRLITLAETCDDPYIGERLKNLPRNIAEAKHKATVAKSETEWGDSDPSEMASEVVARFFDFEGMPRPEQKRILAQYVERIIVFPDDDPDGNVIDFVMRAGNAEPVWDLKELSAKSERLSSTSIWMRSSCRWKSCTTLP